MTALVLLVGLFSENRSLSLSSHSSAEVLVEEVRLASSSLLLSGFQKKVGKEEGGANTGKDKSSLFCKCERLNIQKNLHGSQKETCELERADTPFNDLQCSWVIEIYSIKPIY